MPYDQTFTKVGFQSPVAFTIAAAIVLLLATLPFLKRRYYAVVVSLLVSVGLIVAIPIFPLNVHVTAFVLMLGSAIQVRKTKSRLVIAVGIFSSVCWFQFFMFNLDIATEDVLTMGDLAYLGRQDISQSNLNLTEYRHGGNAVWSARDGEDSVELLFEKDYYYSDGKLVSGRKVAEYLAQWSQRPVQMHTR